MQMNAVAVKIKHTVLLAAQQQAYAALQL